MLHVLITKKFIDMNEICINIVLLLYIELLTKCLDFIELCGKLEMWEKRTIFVAVKCHFYY